VLERETVCSWAFDAISSSHNRSFAASAQCDTMAAALQWRSSSSLHQSARITYTCYRDVSAS